MKTKFMVVIVIALGFLRFGGMGQVRNIVFVHGAFADGSGWQKVYTILQERGYNVNIVGNPLTGIDDDVAATQRVLDRQNGPVILVGHSYGGAIITIAGNSPNVAGLVYVAAFSPDDGNAPPGQPAAHRSKESRSRSWRGSTAPAPAHRHRWTRQ